MAKEILHPIPKELITGQSPEKVQTLEPHPLNEVSAQTVRELIGLISDVSESGLAASDEELKLCLLLIRQLAESAMVADSLRARVSTQIAVKKGQVALKEIPVVTIYQAETQQTTSLKLETREPVAIEAETGNKEPLLKTAEELPEQSIILNPSEWASIKEIAKDLNIRPHILANHALYAKMKCAIRTILNPRGNGSFYDRAQLTAVAQGIIDSNRELANLDKTGLFTSITDFARKWGLDAVKLTNAIHNRHPSIKPAFSKGSISRYPIEALEAVARESGLIKEEQIETPATPKEDLDGKKKF